MVPLFKVRELSDLSSAFAYAALRLEIPGLLCLQRLPRLTGTRYSDGVFLFSFGSCNNEDGSEKMIGKKVATCGLYSLHYSYS